jgi:hypothetical protein
VKYSGCVLTIIVLAGCGGMDYKPAQERPLAQIAAEGCRDKGERLLITGQVSKAYENTVVLWDGIDPQATLAVTVPGRSPLSRARGWFGKSKHEVSRTQLNELIAARTPVTAELVCQGGNVAPEASSFAYTNAQGQRVAIGY